MTQWSPQLAIIGDEVSQDLDTVLDVLHRTGYRGLELRSVWDTPPHLLSDAQAREVGDRCEAAGVEVIGLDAPVCKSDLPRGRAEIDAERDVLLRCLELARTVGASFIRCFTFYRDGAPDPRAAVAAFAEVIADIDVDGVDLLIETGMRTNTPTIPLTLEFLRHLDRDEVGILWDPGNSAFSGIEPEPFPGDWVAGRHRIRHVHVKDPRGQAEYVRLGEGDLDWPAIVGRLADDGYDGWLSLETHWRADRVLDQAERDRPWGAEFSRGGVEASTLCMQDLAAIAERVGTRV